MVRNLYILAILSTDTTSCNDYKDINHTMTEREVYKMRHGMNDLQSVSSHTQGSECLGIHCLMVTPYVVHPRVILLSGKIKQHEDESNRYRDKDK